MNRKIVFFVHRYWPAVGGVEKYIHRLAQALQRLGHQVCVVAGAHQDGLAPMEEHEGVPIRRYPAYRSVARAAATLLRMRSVFADADVIHVSDTFMLEYFYRMLAWNLPRRPIFLTRHGMSYIWPVPACEKLRAQRSLRWVDGIVHDGCFIETWLNVAPDCVPNQGLYPVADDLTPIPEPRSNHATFVGRLEPDSGIQIYIDALDVLKHRYQTDVRLDVYGDGSLAASLKAQVSSRRLDVRFSGWRSDAQEHICDGRFAFVAGRMAMQESMARRRLVVAAYVDPLKRDYVNGEPFSPNLVSAGDAQSLAALVDRYSRNDALRREKIEQAFAYAKTLSWEKTAEQYLSLWSAAPRRVMRSCSALQRARLAWKLRQEARHAVALPVG